MYKRVVFISLPMSGLPDELVRSNIELAKEAYLAITKLDITHVAFVDNLNCPDPNDEWPDTVGRDHVWYLGHALEKLSKCDEAFFWLGWKKARGCMIEHEVCTMHNIPRISVEMEGCNGQ